jgi:hypothetical protein
MEAPESAKRTLAQVIAYYTQDTTVLSQKDVPGVPEEVISKESAIPPGDSPISVPTIISPSLTRAAKTGGISGRNPRDGICEGFTGL